MGRIIADPAVCLWDPKPEEPRLRTRHSNVRQIHSYEHVPIVPPFLFERGCSGAEKREVSDGKVGLNSVFFVDRQLSTADERPR